MRVLRFAVVLFLGLALLACVATYAQERRMREEAQSSEFDAVAAVLDPGQMLLWVGVDGTDVVASGAVCGAFDITWDRIQDDEVYREDVFGPLEALLEAKTGRTLESLTDILVVFESGVPEQIILNYRLVFRRYKVYWLDCCSKSQGYSCCPNTLDPYFVYNASIASLVDVADLVHAATERTISSIEAIVVSDGSLDDFSFEESHADEDRPSFFEWLAGLLKRKKDREQPSLIRWLETQLPSEQIHTFELSMGASNDAVIRPNEECALLPTSLVLAIAVYDASEVGLANAAVENAILQAIGDLQDDPLVVLFLIPDPREATVAPGLAAAPTDSFVGTGTVYVSATSQHVEVLRETLATLLELTESECAVTVDMLTDALRSLGLIAHVF